MSDFLPSSAYTCVNGGGLAMTMIMVKLKTPRQARRRAGVALARLQARELVGTLCARLAAILLHQVLEQWLRPQLGEAECRTRNK
jgi:hypothetical protein